MLQQLGRDEDTKQHILTNFEACIRWQRLHVVSSRGLEGVGRSLPGSRLGTAVARRRQPAVQGIWEFLQV